MFGASWPPFTSSIKENGVIVEWFHGSGSSTVIGWVGAIAASGGTRRRSGRRTKTKGRAVGERRQKERGQQR
jgi:hypothetical protein